MKGSLSSLGVSARRLVKGSLSSLSGCRAADGIPRAGTEAADSSHAGGEFGRRVNGLSRQATGVSRSEASGWPRCAASCLKTQEYFSVGISRSVLSPAASARDLFRVSGPWARGSVKTGTDILADIDRLGTRLLFGQASRQSWGHLLIDRKPKPNASAGIWLKRKHIPESCSGAKHCLCARGLVAVKLQYIVAW